MGLNPGSPGSRPGLKAEAQPLSHPGVPHIPFLKFKFNYPTYSTYLVSDAVFNNLSVVYNTQCSSHHVPSFMSITQSHNSAILSHQLCEGLLQQPQETNTVGTTAPRIFKGREAVCASDFLSQGSTKSRRFFWLFLASLLCSTPTAVVLGPSVEQ